MWNPFGNSAKKKFLKIPIDEFQREKYRLQAEAKKCNLKLRALSKERDDLLFRGYKADKLERMSLLQELKVKDQESKSALLEFKRLHAEMAVNNHLMSLRTRLEKQRNSTIYERLKGKDTQEIVNLIMDGQIDDAQIAGELSNLLHEIDAASTSIEAEYGSDETHPYMEAWKKMDEVEEDEAVNIGKNVLKQYSPIDEEEGQKG